MLGVFPPWKPMNVLHHSKSHFLRLNSTSLPSSIEGLSEHLFVRLGNLETVDAANTKKSEWREGRWKTCKLRSSDKCGLWFQHQVACEKWLGNLKKRERELPDPYTYLVISYRNELWIMKIKSSRRCLAHWYALFFVIKSYLIIPQLIITCAG